MFMGRDQVSRLGRRFRVWGLGRFCVYGLGIVVSRGATGAAIRVAGFRLRGLSILWLLAVLDCLADVVIVRIWRIWGMIQHAPPPQRVLPFRKR